MSDTNEAEAVTDVKRWAKGWGEEVGTRARLGSQGLLRIWL